MKLSNRTRDLTDPPILEMGSLYVQSRLRGWGNVTRWRPKWWNIMLFHINKLTGKVLAEEFAILFKIKLSFLTNVPLQNVTTYCSRVFNNRSVRLKLWRWNKNCILKQSDDMATPVKVGSWCLPISISTVCHQSLKLKGRKVSLHPYARDLAVGFWVGSDGCETAQFDFTVGVFFYHL